MVPLK
jgi:hypothetical protein